ncbi:MAG: nitroreductase family protein [Desulfovibrio sp.]
MAKKAQLAIVVCADPSVEKYPGFWVQDCSAATQNLLLAAHGLGLGAVWTAVHHLEDRVQGFKDLMELPEGIIPVSCSVIGWPAHEGKRVDRFKEERVHRNTW